MAMPQGMQPIPFAVSPDFTPSATPAKIPARETQEPKIVGFQPYGAPAPDPAAGSDGNWATDSARMLKMGANMAAQDVRELVGKIPVVGQPIQSGLDWIDAKTHGGVSSDELLKKDNEAMQAGMSSAAQTAMDKKWWDQEKGTFGNAWSDPRAYQAGILQSLPEQALMMFPAMRMAKGAYAAKIAAGATPEAASLAAARTAQITGTVAEGALGGAQSSRQVRDEILDPNKVTDEMLSQSEAFQALMRQGMDSSQARKTLADDQASRAFVTAGVATGLFGGMGDRLLAKIITSPGGIAKRFATGAVSEGVAEELPQSYLQQVAQNEAMQGANPNQSLTDDALNQALQGMATGAVQGGGMAAAFGHHEAQRPQQTPPPPDQSGAPPSGGPGALEGEYIPAGPNPNQLSGDGFSGNVYEQGRPALDQQRLLPGPDMGGPTDRQVTTAIGLLNHSPRPSPELLGRLMGVNDTLAGMLYSHWEGSRNGAIDRLPSTEVAPQGGTGSGDVVPGSGVVHGDNGSGFASGVDQTPQVASAGSIQAAPVRDPVQELPVLTGAIVPPVTDHIDAAAHAAAPSPLNDRAEPTQAQKLAGNYAKGHIKFQGLDISIENPQGSVRSGVDANGNAWQTEMRAHYGYVRGTVGRDKDHVDVFIKPEAKTAHMAYVVDQIDPQSGRFDEHKIVLGADSEEDARRVYLSNYQPGWNGIGAITAMPVEQFKTWVRNKAATRRPVAYQEPAEVKAKTRRKPKASSLLQAIVNRGGISREIMQDVGADPSGHYMPGLFTKSGTTDLAALAEYLFNEDGFHQIDQNSDIGPARELEELISRALHGDTVLSTDAIEGYQRAEETAQLKVKARALGVKTAFRTTEQIAADVQRIEEQNLIDQETELEDEALIPYNDAVDSLRAAVGEDDAESFLESLASRYQDETHLNYLRRAAIDIKEKIDEQVRVAGQREEPAAGAAGQGDEAGRQEGGARAVQQGERAPAAGADAFSLQSQSEQDLAREAQQRAEADAQRQREEHAAEQKRQADAERGSFTLTGSDRPADVLAAQGQIGLFDSTAKGSDRRNGAVEPDISSGQNQGKQASAQEKPQDISTDKSGSNVPTEGSPFELPATIAGKPVTEISDKILEQLANSSQPAAEKAKKEVERRSRKKQQAVQEQPKPAGDAGVPDEQTKAASTIDAHQAFVKRVRAGEVTAEELKKAYADFNAARPAMEAELSQRTMKELAPNGAGGMKKAEVIGRIIDRMGGIFTLGKSVSWVMGAKGGYEGAVAKVVDGITDADLAKYASDVKQAQAEHAQAVEEAQKAIADPKTLDDYRTYIRAKKADGMTFNEARMSLTPEQRATFDDLTAAESRGERKASADRQRSDVRVAATTTDGQIIETKHTRDGYDLFVVKAAERVDREVYNQWNATAKRLGGWYSSFKGNGAIPGFQFKTKESAQAFLDFIGGKAEKAQEVVQARRDAFADDRSQSAVERLREMADKMEEQAQESLSAERKQNTERRARMAASAEAYARGQQAMADTMRNIATAIESGTAKFLDNVRQKIQVERLQTWLARAQYRQLAAEYPSYSDQEKHRGEAPTAATADYAEFPAFSAERSDLAAMGRRLDENDGTKKLGAQVLKIADDVSAEYLAFAKQNLHLVSTFKRSDGQPAVFTSRDGAEAAVKRSGFRGKAIVMQFKRGQNLIIMGPAMAKEHGVWEGDDYKRITLPPELGQEIVEKTKGKNFGVPYTFESSAADLSRLRAMGIETPAEFRAALREFIALRKEPAQEDRIKKLERAMVGRKKDGLDFFPTSPEVADDMIQAAELEPGMSVLEPSAGMGHIADQIREAGVEPDVVEMSGDRRELLEAKGFNVVGHDFLSLDRSGTPSGAGYDRIILNPPFSDRRDAQHVMHAYELLKPGGRLVAIMGEGVFFGQDGRAQAFRAWLDEVGGSSEQLPEGSFNDPSLPVTTSVNARMLVVDKPAGEEAPKGMESRRATRPVDVNSPEFKRWFGDSKVVDVDGKPLVVYHGTVGDFDTFDFSMAGMKSTGRVGMFFSASAENASNYTKGPFALGSTEPQPGANVAPVYLSLKNPLVIDAKGNTYREIPRPDGWDDRMGERIPMSAVAYQAQEKGYDGVIVRNVVDNGVLDREILSDTFVAFRPEQIKSAIGNRGTFDPNSANIMESRIKADRIEFAHQVLSDLAFEEEAFRYPVSKGGTIESVMADVFPGVESFGDVTLPDEKGETGADHRYGFATPEDKNGKRKQFFVFTTAKRVWINVFDLKPGDQGSRIYAAVANFAYNTGRVFGGDPAGVSPAAILARTRMMLSSALRFGTTRHIEPSVEQERGIPEAMIEPLEWKGDDLAKTRALIHTFITTVQNKAPAIKNYGYDFQNRLWVNHTTGLEFRPSGPAFDAALGEDQRRAAGIGEASGRAAILIQSLVSEEGRGIGDGGILQAVLNGARSLIAGGLRGFLSKTTPATAGVSVSGEATESVKAIRSVVESFKKQFKGATALDIKVVQTAGDIPAAFRPSPFAEGVYHDDAGLIYLVTANLRDEAGKLDTKRAFQVLMHEAVGHYGLAKMMGERFQGILKRVLDAARAKGKVTEDTFKPGDADYATVEAVKLRYPDASDEEIAQEVLARMAETEPGRTLFGYVRAVIRQWIRDVARALGIDVEMTTEELNDLMAKASAYMRRGDNLGAGDGSPFHGAGAAASVKRGMESRKSATSAPIWSAPESTRTDDLIYSLQDKNIDLRRVQEAIKKTAGEIRDDIDTYLQEELFHGRAAKATEEFLERELKPFIGEMKQREIDMESLETYLWARHAAERNAQIAKINPDMPEGGSGLTDRQAADLLSGKDVTVGGKTIKGLPKEKARSYADLAKKVDAMVAGNRMLLELYELEAPDTVAAWRSAYEHYVPLHREDAETPWAGQGTGMGYSVRGSSVKRATGSFRPVENILANLVLQRTRTITRGEKNRVAQALYGMAKAAPNEDFWKTDDAPTVRAVENKAIYHVMDGNTEVANFTSMGEAEKKARENPAWFVYQDWGDRVVERPDPSFRSKPNVVWARFDGQDRFVIFNERDERAARMAAALKNLDADDISNALGEVARWTRYFASINTQYNPVFGIVNLIRDTGTSVLNLSSTPLAGKQAELLGNLYQALPAIYKAVRIDRKGGIPTGTWAQMWEEFQEVGGKTGYRDMFRNSHEQREALEKALDPKWWQDKWWGKTLTLGGVLSVPEQFLSEKIAGPVFEWLSDYNTTMENGIRLSAYKLGLDQGMTKERAASLAKNLTVNFNKKGQVARQVGAMYAFFNASVQGTARIAETLHAGANPGELLGKAGKQIVYGGMLLGAIQAMLLMAAGFDDDEPPEFVRDRNIIIPIGGKKYLTVAMPLGFHVLPAFGRIVTEFVIGGFKKPGEHVVHLFDVLADSFNPIGNAGLSMQTLAPTVLDPAAALAENKDWAGKPIYREDISKLAPTPGFSRTKDTATAFSKALAYALNIASGGTEFQQGMISPTPDQIDYLIGQVTGGVGRELGKVEQTVRATITGSDLPPYKIPLLGRFYGDAKGQSAEGGRFYDNLKAMNEHQAELQGLWRSGRAAQADSYSREHPEATMFRDADRTQRYVSLLRKEKAALEEAGAPRDKVKAADELITKTMRDFNQRVEDAKKPKKATERVR